MHDCVCWHGRLQRMRVLDLFSGIGGFSIGLERAGMQTVAFCESNAFCRRVLSQHWPKVPCYDDIRTLSGAHLVADGIKPDLICGGFPCQDISIAGTGAGIEGPRSGLWSEYARIIGEVRPRYVIVENVAALLHRGLGRVLGDLAAIGYDAEWHCIPASAVGAPHRRDRIWIVANPKSREQQEQPQGDNGRPPEPSWEIGPLAGAGGRNFSWGTAARGLFPIRVAEPMAEDVGNGDGAGLLASGAITGGENWRDPGRMFAAAGWWSSEPNVDRMAHGVPHRVDRLRALGNAIVPQIAEIIGRAILNAPPMANEGNPSCPSTAATEAD